MHDLLRRISRGLAATVLLAALPAAALAQYAPPGVNPTHYWTYTLEQPPGLPTTVGITDQFHPTGLAVTVDRLERLVNWVHKNGSPVQPDTFTHYTWWNIVDPTPTPRVVRVNNQFGSYIVNVEYLEFMLVPAWKNQPQPGFPDANHYTCYRASGFPPPPFSVNLLDEWREDQLQPLELEYLCNPCRKEHGPQTFPIVDPMTHMALFRITPVSDPFSPLIVDQFFQGPQLVRQLPYEYLLVPSEKIDLVTPARPESWGRLKALYR